MIFKNFTYEQRLKIRDSYKSFEDIMSREDVDPYLVWPHDWPIYMSPIERNFWGWIRDNNLFGFYPQYPIGKYFADFCNPTLKVVVELDGKQWHEDSDRDKMRQKYLEGNGYRVVRLSGFGSYVLTETEDEYRAAISSGRKPEWYTDSDGNTYQMTPDAIQTIIFNSILGRQ